MKKYIKRLYKKLDNIPASDDASIELEYPSDLEDSGSEESNYESDETNKAESGFVSFSHSLLLGPQIEICNISGKTVTTDKN